MHYKIAAFNTVAAFATHFWAGVQNWGTVSSPSIGSRKAFRGSLLD